MEHVVMYIVVNRKYSLTNRLIFSISLTISSQPGTAARGLAKVLPTIEVSCNSTTGTLDPYNRKNGSETEKAKKDGDTIAVRKIPTPFVNLPIGATEDRVLGSIDFSATLKQGGKPVFSPGLLAAANRGILYIDEVNLLPAHLVDVLLDASAMGVNTIQREGLA
eukprot:14134481-Ditylum_brightwellii.AAC.1